MQDKILIHQTFTQFLSNREFPCVAAKDALAKGNLKMFVAGHFACPSDDAAILQFIYEFVHEYRKAPNGFHSAAIIFASGGELTELQFGQNDVDEIT